MAIVHPLECIEVRQRKPFLIGLLVVIVLIFGIFRVLDTPLRTGAAPSGIISFELAGSVKVVESILSSWDAQARLFAAFGLGLDHLFMAAYGTGLSLACLLAAGRRRGWFMQLGVWLGWGAFAAVVLDGIENFALWQMLAGSVVEPNPALAAWSASLKFGLILIGMVYALIGWIFPQRQSKV